MTWFMCTRQEMFGYGITYPLERNLDEVIYSEIGWGVVGYGRGPSLTGDGYGHSKS